MFVVDVNFVKQWEGDVVGGVVEGFNFFFIVWFLVEELVVGEFQYVEVFGGKLFLQIFELFILWCQVVF